MAVSRAAQLIKDSVAYVVGFVLRRGLSIITLPIIARYLSQADVGIVALVSTMRDLLSVILELGVPNAAARFFYDLRTEQERKRLFGTLFIFLMGASAVSTLLVLGAGSLMWNRFVPDVPFHPYVSLTFVTVFFMMAAVLPRAIFRVTERVPLFMTLTLVQAVLTVAITIVLVVGGMGALGSVLGALLSSMVFFSFFAGTSARTSPGHGLAA